MIRSVLVEFHRWRGFSRGRDLFDLAVTLGWVTVMFSRLLLSDRLRQLQAALDQLRRRA